MSKDRYSWWDTQAICGQYNNLSLITQEEVVSKEIGWDDNVPTEVGSKILNELGNNNFIFLANAREFGKRDEKICLESGHSDEPTVTGLRVVCR